MNENSINVKKKKTESSVANVTVKMCIIMNLPCEPILVQII